ncbi:hypothetical protein Tco_0382168 [Tanacetum coccineum]
MFGPDAILRPSGTPRKSKPQRSSGSSSSTYGSSKARVTELMQEQILLDREAKKESMDRELATRLAVYEIQKRNEDLKILTFYTTGMNPKDAAKMEALKDKTRATSFNTRSAAERGVFRLLCANLCYGDMIVTLVQDCGKWILFKSIISNLWQSGVILACTVQFLVAIWIL